VQLKIWPTNSKALAAANSDLLQLAENASSDDVVVLHNVYPSISGKCEVFVFCYEFT
jgi:hypothetical protein